MANNAAPARRAVLGLDVGKATHWACMLTRDGEIAVNRPVANSEHELDRLFSQVGEGTLVVVDQVRNIGALPISRARRAGLDVAYLPGMAAHPPLTGANFGGSCPHFPQRVVYCDHAFAGCRGVGTLLQYSRS